MFLHENGRDLETEDKRTQLKTEHSRHFTIHQFIEVAMN